MPQSITQSQLLQYLVAIAVLLIAVLTIVYIVRLLFGQRVRAPGARNRPRRLDIVDAFDLDRERQLVIIRRDNIEHLLLIGGPNDVLVESAIHRAESLGGPTTLREPRQTGSAQSWPAPQVTAEPPVQPLSEAARGAASRDATVAPSIQPQVDLPKQRPQEPSRPLQPAPRPPAAPTQPASAKRTDAPAADYPATAPIPAAPSLTTPSQTTSSQTTPSQTTPGGQAAPRSTPPTPRPAAPAAPPLRSAPARPPAPPFLAKRAAQGAAEAPPAAPKPTGAGAVPAPPLSASETNEDPRAPSTAGPGEEALESLEAEMARLLGRPEP